VGFEFSIFVRLDTWITHFVVFSHCLTEVLSHDSQLLTTCLRMLDGEDALDSKLIIAENGRLPKRFSPTEEQQLNAICFKHCQNFEKWQGLLLEIPTAFEFLMSTSEAIKTYLDKTTVEHVKSSRKALDTVITQFKGELKSVTRDSTDSNWSELDEGISSIAEHLARIADSDDPQSIGDLAPFFGNVANALNARQQNELKALAEVVDERDKTLRQLAEKGSESFNNFYDHLVNDLVGIE
jgi:hypothetical protein